MGKTTSALFIFFVLFSAGCQKSIQPDKEINLTFSNVEKSIDSVFQSMKIEIAKKAEAVANSNIDEKETREQLIELYNDFIYCIDCAFVTPDGKMKFLEPKTYKEFEGADISKQEQVFRLRDTRQPVLSNLFKAVEGFYALDFEYPALKNNKHLGAISILIRPESFLKNLQEVSIQNKSIDLLIIENTGKIIYNSLPTLIGKNLIEDDPFSYKDSFTKSVKNIISQNEGSGELDFPVKQTVNKKKEIFWKKMNLYGIDWKIILMRKI